MEDGAPRNLPLEHVRDKTGLDIAVYRKIAEMVSDQAYAAAEEFAGVLGTESTDQLIHFFHDMFTAACFIPRMSVLSADNDTASAIIDGIHFELYGDASAGAVESVPHLWAEKPECFFQTFASAISEAGKASLFVTMAVYCVDPERQLGATEVLELQDPLMRIAKEKAASIATFVDTML